MCQASIAALRGRTGGTFTLYYPVVLRARVVRDRNDNRHFAFGYGISRFFVEYFRVPDLQFFSDTNPYGFAFKFGEFGITMGQSLSLPMIGVGLVLIAIALRPGARR